MKNKYVAALSVILLAGGILIVIKLRPEDISSIESRLGLWGLVVVGLFILATQVLAPLAGTPGLIISIKIYGLPLTLIMFYLVCMVSAATNFWIARVYGRWLVSRLVGPHLMLEVEEIVIANERTVLIGMRLLGFYLFDTISYAIGLTSIPFLKYYIYTAILTIPPLAAQLILLRYFDFNSAVGLLLYYVSFVISGLLAGHVFRLLYLRRRRTGKT